MWLNAYNPDGDTPLHLAVREGSVGVVSALVDAGAFLEAEDFYASTALHDASQDGHEQIVQLLLAAGAQPNRFDQNGGTPLHDAAWEGHASTVELLLQAGAVPSCLNANGHTAQQMAEKAGHHAVLQLLQKAQSAGKSAADQTSEGTAGAARSPEERYAVPVANPAAVALPRRNRNRWQRELDIKFMNTPTFEVAQRDFDVELGRVGMRFAQRLVAVNEAFQVEATQMEAEYEEALERLQLDYRVKQMEHETRYKAQLSAVRGEQESAEQWVEDQMRAGMLEAQAEWRAGREAVGSSSLSKKMKGLFTKKR